MSIDNFVQHNAAKAYYITCISEVNSQNNVLVFHNICENRMIYKRCIMTKNYYCGKLLFKLFVSKKFIVCIRRVFIYV